MSDDLTPEDDIQKIVLHRDTKTGDTWVDGWPQHIAVTQEFLESLIEDGLVASGVITFKTTRGTKRYEICDVRDGIYYATRIDDAGNAEHLEQLVRKWEAEGDSDITREDVDRVVGKDQAEEE